MTWRFSARRANAEYEAAIATFPPLLDEATELTVAIISELHGTSPSVGLAFGHPQPPTTNRIRID
jgi:hypothetical protein